MQTQLQNRNRVIEAVVIRWDELKESWQLAAAGSMRECEQYWAQARAEGYDGSQMQMIRQNIPKYFPDRSQHANHGWVENVQQYARELVPDEGKITAEQSPDFVQEDGTAIYTTP